MQEKQNAVPSEKWRQKDLLPVNSKPQTAQAEKPEGICNMYIYRENCEIALSQGYYYLMKHSDQKQLEEDRLYLSYASIL